MSAAPPKSHLGYYKILGPNCGLRVSPICLGSMNFGEAWKAGMGTCSKETAFEMLDYFKANGGNFIDTANSYQNEESEMWLGEWLVERGCRDEMVIATKYTSGYKKHEDQTKVIQANYGGNNAKSMRVSVDASLRKLKTDYVDVLYVHWVCIMCHMISRLLLLLWKRRGFLADISFPSVVL